MSNLVENLLNWVLEDFLANVDPLALAQALFNDDVIDASFMDELTEMSSDRSSNDLIGRRMIQCLPYYCSSSQLCNALCKTGNKTLAIRLNRIATSQNVKESDRVITVDAAFTRKHIQLFFKDLKNCIYSCRIEDPQKCLRKMALFYYKKMKLERHSVSRQFLADKLSMILAVELDAPIEEDELFIQPPCSEEQLTRGLIINQMKDIVSETSNPLITNMILFTRVSIEKAIQKKFEEGKNDLKMALQNACQSNPCLEKADMYYRIVHFYHRKFEHYPSDETRKSLMTFAEIGLCMLCQEAEIVQYQWRILFCIRMIFCQLCMSTECRIIPQSVRIEGIEKSKTLLTLIENSWEGITNKTKLLYYMAKARLCEVTNDIQMAVSYTKKTEQIALANRSKHLKYINEYLCFLTSSSERDFRITAVCNVDNLDSTENSSVTRYAYHTSLMEKSKSITLPECKNLCMLHETASTVLESRETTELNYCTNKRISNQSIALEPGSKKSTEYAGSIYTWTNREHDSKPTVNKHISMISELNSVCSSETFSFDDDLLFGDGP